MRLTITDVTEMSTGNYCVAGWDAQAQRMVRPLPGGNNWTAGLLLQFGIGPGATIDFVPTGHPHAGAFPHSTEDTPVVENNIQHVGAGPINWFGAGAPPAQGTVAAAFLNQVAHNSEWGNVRQGVYVPIGTQVGSLSAIQRPRNAVQFIEDVFGNDPPKLKVLLNDGTARYKLAVSSRTLKEAWRFGGLAALDQALPASAQFHIRLGLARAFDNPLHRCYMMVNGIHG
jgi:hypothetical protein